MSLLIDEKYIKILSERLDRFTSHKGYYNFRCPVCGDSQKSKKKARGYFLKKNDYYVFYCHNCNASYSLRRFIQYEFNDLYSSYVLENAKENYFLRKKKYRNSIEENNNSQKSVINTPKNEYSKGLIPVKENEKAFEYCQNRKILDCFYDDLFYVENFPEWAKQYKEFNVNLEKDERIVCFIRNRENKIVGLQARSLDPTLEHKYRFFTIRFDESERLLFNIQRIDFSKPYFVCEGLFDAMSLNNTIAMLTSNLANFKNYGYDLTNAYFISDNETRNKEVMREVKKCVDADLNVCFWKNVDGLKDINDMVKKGLDVKSIILKNSFSGLKAKLEFTKYSKC